MMTAELLLAFKRRYFPDNADLFFHGCVIVDVIIEGSLYEAARLAGYIVPGETELLATLHNKNNFYGCAVAFTLVIGFPRWRIMTAKRRHDTALAT